MEVRRSLRQRLATKRALLGFMQTHPHLAIAEVAAMCGYDFLILDGEHGLFAENDYLQTLQVLGSADIAVFVRLSGHTPAAIGRYLDMGAQGIVVPNVTTAEQAIALVRAMSYPPAGTRGFGASVHRATRYGMDLVTHLKSPRDGLSLIVMIESQVGVANADQILAIDGVDGAFIGPFDLSADLGCAGDFSQTAYLEAISRIERAASTTGKILGTGEHPGYSLETLLARGHRLLLLNADMPLIREAMSAQVAAAKACL